VNGDYDFDGIDDMVDTGITTDYPQITLTAWINPRDMSKDGRIYQKGGLVFTTLASNAIQFCRPWTGGGICLTSPQNSLSPNSWQLVAVTYDGSSAANDPSIYIFRVPDGQLQKTTGGVDPSGSLLNSSDSEVQALFDAVIGPIPPAGKIYYVDGPGGDGVASCNDGNVGDNINSPLCTLQAAVNKVGPGDTVRVRGGTYAESNITIDTGGNSGAWLTITNYPGEARMGSLGKVVPGANFRGVSLG
jgi:hypothetical protein